MPLWWVFAFYLVERSLELAIAARNRQRLLARGAVELHAGNYRAIVGLHSLFFVALLVESFPWWVPLDGLTLFSLAALALLMGLRYACIAALGPFWNSRILVLPGAQPVRRGPYRLFKHPNYLVVTLEFALIPLLMRAPVTLFLFSLANLILLRQRIGYEERALAEYGESY